MRGGTPVRFVMHLFLFVCALCVRHMAAVLVLSIPRLGSTVCGVEANVRILPSESAFPTVRELVEVSSFELAP